LDLYASQVSLIEPGAPRRSSPCTVCRDEWVRARFAVAGLDAPIVVCETCGLGRFDPLPDAETIAGFYPDDYYGEPDSAGSKFRPWIEWLVRLVAARHLDFLCAGLPPGARVLDIGCGRGVILGPLADRGFEAHGVEVSEAATRGVDPRARIRIATSLAEADYPQESFDQVVIWHVLEHLADPRATLEECHRVLRPGGRLIVAVPNFSSWQARWAGPAWFHLDPPRHLYQFPLGALRRLIDDCGFACGASYHFSLRQNPFGWIQSALNRMDPAHPNRLYTALHHPAQRTVAAPGGEDLRARAGAALVLALGALPSLALSAAEALAGQGATVHVVATRSAAAPDDGARTR